MRLGVLASGPHAPPDAAAAPPALVFLHGVGSDATAWRPQMHAFASTHHCLAYDMPGYRGSMHLAPSAAGDAAALARLVATDLQDRLAPQQRLHVVGLSLGAVVAANLATQVRGLASLTLASAFLAYPDGSAVAQRACQAARDEGMEALAASRVDRILHRKAPAPLRAEVRMAMARIPVAAYVRMAQAVWTADLRPIAGTVAPAALVLNGEADPVTPPAMGAALAAALPHARHEVVAEASHLVNLDQAEAFNALLRAHMERNP